MKRKFTLLLTVLFTLFTLPVNSFTVLAAEDENKVYKDGEYDVPLTILDANEDKESTMQTFLKENISYVTIKDGKVSVTATFTSADMIKNFEVGGVKATVDSENEADKERTYSFHIKNLDEIIGGKVAVEVPGMYDTTHDIRLKFDASDIPVADNDQTDPDDGTDEDSDSDDGTDEDSDSDDGTDEDSDSDDGTDEDSDSDDGTDEDSGSEDGTDEDSDSEDGTDEKPVDPESMKDGIYEINYEVDYEGQDFSKHFTQPATLTLEKDELYLQFEHKDTNVIKKITISNGEVDVISEDEENKTKVVGFTIDNDLSKPVDMGLEMVYGMTHDVKVNFDLDSLKVVEFFEDPADPVSMKDGIYEVNYEVDYEGEDFSKHFTQPATLTLEKDELYLQFEHKDTNFIKKITISNGEVDVISEDEENKTKVVGFTIDNDLSKPVDIGLEMVYGMTHDVKVNFDLDTLKLIKEIPTKEPEDPKKDPKPEPKPEPKPTPKKNQLVPDKVYEIDFTILDEYGAKVSAADYFFVKPGILLEKDGVLYAQLTITEGDMVKELSNKYGPVLIVERNKDGSIVVQFKVDKDLSDMNLDMIIDVPGVYDNREHKAILVFDKDSMNEIAGSDYKLIASNTDNGPTVEGARDGQQLGEGNGNGATPTKPTFGTNDEDGQEVAASTNGDPKNPQTGDTSAIMFYALLLIGSLIPLAVKFKRRFV